MLLDLKFSIGTLGIGSGAFVAALYGMNLKNFIEDSDYAFMGVSGWCGALAVVVCMYGLSKLRRVQRVSMWGESGRRGPSWRHAESKKGAMRSELDIGRNERVERYRRLREERLGALVEVRGNNNAVRQKQEVAVVAAGEHDKK